MAYHRYIKPNCNNDNNLIIYMGKRILILLQITIVSIASLNAITKEEMEQARATTALWYLRYVNDGSDYLEKLSPSTIEELQKHLKNKEKENIKVFLSVPIPTDYATWDKSKMVEYWSKTIFKNPDFPEKAQSAKRRIKSKLEAMDIALPQDNKREEISSGIIPVASDSVSISSEQQLEVINEDSVHNAEETIVEDINEAEYSDSKNNSSSTYIYIIIFSIILRCFIDYELWGPIVLAVTISSILFAVEDVFRSLSLFLHNLHEIAHTFVNEARRKTTKDLEMLYVLNKKANDYKDCDNHMDQVIEIIEERKKLIDRIIEEINKIELDSKEKFKLQKNILMLQIF